MHFLEGFIIYATLATLAWRARRKSRSESLRVQRSLQADLRILNLLQPVAVYIAEMWGKFNPHSKG
jgi:heme A synthase